jgi:hypothetical protein
VIEAISSKIVGMTPYIDDYRLNEYNQIVLKFKEAFSNSEYYNHNNNYRMSYLYATKDEFKNWLKNTLFSIPEYENLNLSYLERINNISVHDDNRSSYKFTSAYDVVAEDSWKDDFIDLDALFNNILRTINHIMSDDDCFLCTNADSDLCTTCTLNKKYKNNYNCENKPFGKDYNKWCKESCNIHKAICCYDCEQKHSCKDRCSGSYFTNEENVTCKGMVWRNKHECSE